MKKSSALLLAAALLAGCMTLARHNLDQAYGPEQPDRFDHALPGQGPISYRSDIQPILDNRCVVCHACYDGPCQLKLSAWDGIARGASKAQVYDGTRLLEAPLTRLFIDAERPSEWRQKDFHPVLNERPGNPAAELDASPLARMLRLKARHPLPENTVLPDSFDFAMDREQQCPRIEEFDGFEADHPLWGMPFGLPGLSAGETAKIERWLQLGAPFEGAPPLPAGLTRQVATWEAFFNGDSLKERLTARYLYEHLFLGHLYFADGPKAEQRHFFRLVRSATPPGEPVQLIATRRPFDVPGVERVYYRLVPERESISVKTHMPYALSDARMTRWRQLFLAPDYPVDELPSYSPEAATNPFRTFRDLPVEARYRFMLDEAEFTIMGFIKGPVCRGQTALNVIEDHFWVFFNDPAAYQESDADFLERESRNLSMPAEWQSNAPVLGPWLKYSRLEANYLDAKSRYLAQRLDRPDKLTQALIWNGDGRNPNAALTVYRHFDSATVLKGMVGEPPKTAWVLTYPLIERIHYLLVAGYDVYGNIGHQLNTRLYMDFLRMEGEFNFLILLPKESRMALRDYWYRGASEDTKNYVYGRYAFFDGETGIPYASADPKDAKAELFGLLRDRLGQALSRTDSNGPAAPLDSRLAPDLAALKRVSGTPLAWMPELAFLRIDGPGNGAEYVSLVRNTGHLNVSQLLMESKTIVPGEHTLDVLPGLVGAYPNAIYRVRRADLPAFAAAVAALGSDEDYRALVDRFGVRRSSPAFWPVSDALHAELARREPIEAGLLDYNRLENR